MALMRIFALIFAVVVTFSITSCGRKTPPVIPAQGLSSASIGG